MRRLALLLLFLLFASTATAATIRGTKAANLIVGSPTPDRISAGGGNDRVQAAFGGTDNVDCGAGLDIVSADTGDSVAANCEVVSRRLSVDPYANTDSQHETAVEPDSASFGDTVVAVFQVGRRDQGGASNIGTAVSRNDGRTWTRAELPGITVNASPPGPEEAASDPAVAYDAVHGVWLASTLTIERDGSHVYTARSTDGEHWAAPVVAAGGPALDKDWIACDNGASSPFRGRCYIEYTDDATPGTISEFTNDGGQTWSGPIRAATVPRRHAAGRAAEWNARRRGRRLHDRRRAQRIDGRAPLDGRRRLRFHPSRSGRSRQRTIRPCARSRCRR